MVREVYCGLTGDGKTLMLAMKGLELLERNRQFYKKTGKLRPILSRMRFAKHIEQKYQGYIKYWDDMEQLVDMRDCDILWDELAADLDSTQWEKVPMRVRWWFRMHDKRGVDIYATAQDFISVFNHVRRLTDRLFVVRKVLGSRRPSPTKPPIKKIWGLIFCNEVKREDFLKEKEEYRYYGIFPRLIPIRKKYCHAYDTTQEFEPAGYPPLDHRERKCLECGEVKIFHV